MTINTHLTVYPCLEFLKLWGLVAHKPREDDESPQQPNIQFVQELHHSMKSD